MPKVLSFRNFTTFLASWPYYVARNVVQTYAGTRVRRAGLREANFRGTGKILIRNAE